MGGSFVLSGLQTILFVVQNRLEMGAGGPNSSRKMLRGSRFEMARNSRSSPQDQVHERRLAQVKLRERSNWIGWNFCRQGESVTARLPFAAQGKKPCPDVTLAVRLWPRVEISRSFVLRELRRFLHIWQNRVEMRLGRPNPSRKTLWGSRVEMQPRSTKLTAWF